MEGRYDILSGGEVIGTLRVGRQGLLTVFAARAVNRGGILRLSVYGEGREGYLGVMSPAGDGQLALRRALSRAALTAFPRTIEYAAPAGQLNPRPASNPPAQTNPPAQANPPTPTAPPAQTPASETDTLWHRAPDGTLRRYEGRRLLIALPAGDPRLPPGAPDILRVIEGRKYVVFPW